MVEPQILGEGEKVVPVRRVIQEQVDNVAANAEDQLAAKTPSEQLPQFELFPRLFSRPSSISGKSAVQRQVNCCTNRSSRPSIVPQNTFISGESRDLYPENWGITLKMLRALIDECKTNPRWTRRTSVRTLVDDYVKPKTAGKGVGYAVLTGPDEVTEVTIMVSHSWNEPAEEFLETLERTAEEHDVLFICAVSLFQNEDGSGPSVSEQLGDTAEANPFYQVLDQLSRRGQDAGRWWMPRYSRFGLSLNMVVFAILLLWLPLVLQWRIYTLSGIVRWTGSEWLEEGNAISSRFFIITAACATMVAFLLFFFPDIAPIYCGRMVAVPNCEDDLYGRLWVVYEMFVALQNGIHVQLAPTMASAGEGSCKEAKCSSPDDEARIRNEIQQSCGGYDRVDHAVWTLMTPQWRSWLFIKSFALLLFLAHLANKDSVPLLAVKLVILVWWAWSCWWMAVSLQGRFTCKSMALQVMQLGTFSFVGFWVHFAVKDPFTDEVWRFAFGVAAAQALLFVADILSFRLPNTFPGRLIVISYTFIAGQVSADRRYLQHLDIQKPIKSFVLLLGFLIPGPFLLLGLHVLDRHFGIHLAPSSVGADSFAKHGRRFMPACLRRKRKEFPKSERDNPFEMKM